jgi:hypothetical protein
MALHFDFVRVRDGQSAEQHRVSARVNELVPFDRDERQFLVVLGVGPLAWAAIPPPRVRASRGGRIAGLREGEGLEADER